jgi:hypothetical protein
MSSTFAPCIGLEPDRSLAAAASLWFGVATVGQWLFALYVLGLYGARLFVGGLPGLADTLLTNSYVAADTIGNTVRR